MKKGGKQEFLQKGLELNVFDYEIQNSMCLFFAPYIPEKPFRTGNWLD